MPTYWGDYFAETAHLSCEQHGAYLQLLGRMWQAGGSLPMDSRALARMTGCTTSRWAKISGEILPYFLVVDGRLTHKRVVAELKIAQEIALKRAEAGSRGGRAKSLKDKKSDVANAIAEPLAELQHPLPVPVHTEDKSSVCDAHAMKDGFEKWWSIYPSAVAKPKARKAYETACALVDDGCPHERLLSGLKRSLSSPRWKDPSYTIPNPARWLEEERWNDAAVATGKVAAPSEMSSALRARRKALLES